MKKLLALVLCVMMFVSIIPTAAFAAYDTTDQRVWAGASQSKDIVDALRKNIENMQGSLAVDNAVVSSMKSINTLIGDMVDEMMKGYSPSGWGTGLSSDTLSDAIKLGLRQTIGGSITDYVSKHAYQFVDRDSHGNAVFNPFKYAGVFAKAASEAVAGEKAVAGIQAFMLYVLQRSTYESVAQNAGLLLADMPSWWGDYGFDDAAKATPSGWSVPATAINNIYNLDGVMHHVNHTYAEFLSRLGQLGADLDADGSLSIGFEGWALDVDGNLRKADAGTDERVNTPLLRYLYSDLDGNGTIEDDEITGIVYENATGTYWVDTTGDGVADSLDRTGVFGQADPITTLPSPYFLYQGKDAAGNWIDDQTIPVNPANEGAIEALIGLPNK